LIYSTTSSRRPLLIPTPPPKPHADGGFRRALPCPPGVTFCITASPLPPLDFRQIWDGLSQPQNMRLMRTALGSTLGASPYAFLRDAVARGGRPTFKVDEVVYGMAAYLAAVNPGPDVHIYPGGPRLPGCACVGRSALGSGKARLLLAVPSASPRPTSTPPRPNTPHPTTSAHKPTSPPPTTNKPPSGKYHKNPWTIWEWLMMLIIPPTPEQVDTIVDMGTRDATSWAVEQGLLPASAAPPDAPPAGAPASAADAGAARVGGALTGLLDRLPDLGRRRALLGRRAAAAGAA
jgi:hypothetical protein